jgi:AcrR family transcriptional regulator
MSPNGSPVSPTASEQPAKGGRYHHGDLRAALVDTTIDLIAERGVHGFSLAEASRRLGVTAAAPYRHFADRDELLAAVAVRALAVFTAMLEAEPADTQAPEQRLAAMTRAYVHFAAEQRPLFETLFGTAIDKSRYPELVRAYEPVDKLFMSSVGEICENDPRGAEALAAVLEASAHGHAALLLEGEYGQGPDAVRVAVDQAAGATLALIEGRKALATSADSPARP